MGSNFVGWMENTAVAIPPNKAGCGPNGGFLVSNGRHYTDDTGLNYLPDDNITVKIIKDTLSCYTSGQGCAQSSVQLNHTTPAGYEDWLNGSQDNNTVRLRNGHIISSHMVVRWTPTQQACNPQTRSCRRGTATFFDSKDCGANWTEFGQLDGGPGTDFDRGTLFADPYSDCLYYVVNNTDIPGNQDTKAYKAGYTVNGAGQLSLSAWSLITPSLPMHWYGTAGTVLQNHRFYFFSCPNGPTLRFYDLPTGTLSPAYSLPGETCHTLPGLSFEGSIGISQIGSFADGDYVRVSYPQEAGTRQKLRLSVVKITGSASSPTFSTLSSTTFQSTNPNGSITDVSVIEADRTDIPQLSLVNDAMYYWLDTSGGQGAFGTTTVKGFVAREKNYFTPVATLSTSAPWTFFKDGDYVQGASYYDATTQSVNFLPIWAEQTVVAPNDLSKNRIQTKLVTVKREDLMVGYDNRGGVYGSGIAASSWGAGRLDMFGLGTDGKLYHSSYDSSSGWACCDAFNPPPGLTLTSDPAAVSWGNGRIDIVQRASDNAIWHMAYDSGSTWSGWDSLGGVLSTGPGIASWGSGRLDVFALDSAGALWHQSYGSAGWAGWEGLGGTFKYAPAAVSKSFGTIDIMAVGTDNAMRYKTYGPSGWSAVSSLDGAFSSRPTITGCCNNRLDAYAVGIGGLLYHKSWNTSSGWSGWLSLPGSSTAYAPGAVSWGSGRTDVFLVGTTDSQMRHIATP